METVKIKCPCCSATLMVKKTPGIERKNIKCPVCQESSPFVSYRQLVDNAQCDKTQYPGQEQMRQSTGEETDLGDGLNSTLGELRVMSADVPAFKLKEGRNVIGRDASASSADFRIPTPDSKRLSREHLVIEVKKVPGKGLVHYVSLYKEHVNDTRINGVRLEYGDCIVLRNGDKLRLPDVSLQFVIGSSPDEDMNT